MVAITPKNNLASFMFGTFDFDWGMSVLSSGMEDIRDHISILS